MITSRRKARPINRETQVFRDDRLYLVASDDTYAPKQYFTEYQKDFLGSRLQVEVIPTEDGTSSAEHVLNRLLEFKINEGDQRWMFLDTDHYIRREHRKSFIQAIHRAKQNGVKVAVSMPCFEFWLLLHICKSDDEAFLGIKNASGASNLLKLRLGKYNKKKLDMEKFPMSTVPNAIITGREIDNLTRDGDIPEGNTSRVYLLWEEIIKNATLKQLPEELHDLKLRFG